MKDASVRLMWGVWIDAPKFDGPDQRGWPWNQDEMGKKFAALMIAYAGKNRVPIGAVIGFELGEIKVGEATAIPPMKPLDMEAVRGRLAEAGLSDRPQLWLVSFTE